MNVRSVNYTITDKGEYIPHEGIVDTRNYQAQWNPATLTWDHFQEVSVDLPRREDTIRGLEDIRICNGKFTATTREFS